MLYILLSLAFLLIVALGWRHSARKRRAERERLEMKRRVEFIESLRKENL